MRQLVYISLLLIITLLSLVAKKKFAQPSKSLKILWTWLQFKIFGNFVYFLLYYFWSQNVSISPNHMLLSLRLHQDHVHKCHVLTDKQLFLKDDDYPKTSILLASIIQISLTYPHVPEKYRMDTNYSLYLANVRLISSRIKQVSIELSLFPCSMKEVSITKAFINRWSNR